MKYEEKGSLNLNLENTNKNEILDFNVDQQQTLKKRAGVQLGEYSWWGVQLVGSTADGEYSSGDAAAGEGRVCRIAGNITQWVNTLTVQAAQGE